MAVVTRVTTLPRPYSLSPPNPDYGVFFPPAPALKVIATLKLTLTLIAWKVIVTLPLGVLKSGAVTFEPPLPPWKNAAIQVSYGIIIGLCYVAGYLI